ncbi:tRNA dihydrouridine synthase [Spirobacillus cienkowskii]|jgi:tRNA-dihydrouridine synthase B|uniref:tRNA-dihydrouridine synthase n=1 Tax=Spirobacillus cienkowskii TaxID=495820 RepID=A0A369KUW3_9BACT|nr:MAG: tRNA-dihydrouridine synthase family protein [Spirobacillus cienkowskii]
MENNNKFILETRLSALGIEFPFFIAPMVGLSHVAFRELIASYTPKNIFAIKFTEMLSTRRIPNEKLETTNELKVALGEKYYIPQLLGNEERYLAPSILKLLEQDPWGFDINMGCTVAHTLKHNWGVRLMGDEKYASDVVKIVKKFSTKPVSVKLRGGISENETFERLLSFTSSLENAGANFITIHARTKEQKHSGDANWSLVSDIRRKLSIPVVANGNIQTAQDAVSVLKNYEVDGVMIARAATARPWILWQISELLGYGQTPIGYEGKKAPQSPEEEGAEYAQACLRFIKILTQYFDDESYILEKFRFFVATGARWFLFGHHFWKISMKSKSVTELYNNVLEFSHNCNNTMTQHIKMF